MANRIRIDVNDLKLEDNVLGAERTLTQLAQLTGWIPADETWTYASASTFTISGDKTGKYSVGMKIKLIQTTAKYFYISVVSYSDPNTTITVNGAGLYTVAEAAITSPCYSSANMPQGFPINMIPGYIKCSVSLSSNMANITNNTWTKALLDTEAYDIGNCFASNKFTAPVTGYYNITAQIHYLSTNVADGKSFFLGIYVNNVLGMAGQANSSVATQVQRPYFYSVMKLNKDDYVELFIFHLNATNTITVVGDVNTFMNISLASII